MGDVLEVADVFAGLEIQRNQRVRVEIVAGPVRAVEIGRGIADDEIDPVGRKIDGRILPHAAAELLQRDRRSWRVVLLGLDIAVHVAAGGVLGRPDADGILRNRVECPEQLAGLGIIGLHEAADAVFAAIGSDQNLVLDHGRRHRLAVSELGIRDVGLPDDVAGLCIQRHELGVERGKIDAVAENLDAAIVGTAAIGRYRPHLVTVVPELRAGLGVKRVDMAERRRHKHDAVDDDRRSLQQFLDVGLEDPGDVQVLYVVAIDLLGRDRSASGHNCRWSAENWLALVGCVELLLGNRRNICLTQHRLDFLLGFLLGDTGSCE